LFTLAGHLHAVVSAAFSPDGRQIVSGAEDALVKIWNAETGTEVSNAVGMRCCSRTMMVIGGVSAHPPSPSELV